MNARSHAVQEAGKRIAMVALPTEEPCRPAAEYFGDRIFNLSEMQKRLPPEVFENVYQASLGLEKIRPDFADTIAIVIKDWAIAAGATHYTHWFQPLTGTNAEKHDAFIDWDKTNGVIEKFTGKQLVQGEPDASSFPSGGLRSTYEARGYTGWDPTSPVFLWRAGDGVTLCIPSVFFSWTGDVLDTRIPLLRSDKKINDAALRLLRLTGIPAKQVYSTLGLEQEYFVIDRALRNLRPDLVMLGKTVFGAAPPKGQELQDHYFGSVKDRILNYMCEFEEAAIHLGIPVKTRHNEVAPAQHEVAPVFEKSSKAIDHNLLLMELMRQVAGQHNLACLLHEKPFKGINGSGKHCNWSLSTDTGKNLLDPTDTPENNLHFLILLTAILHAVHEHSALLRASIGSASNDYRLGAHEAPPAIISIYLGQEIESLLTNIENEKIHVSARSRHIYDLGIAHTPDFVKDNTDRNRTSPFAFTGNKFEFRAVGSSANPALPTTVLNVIVAESLHLILDEIEEAILEKGHAAGKQEVLEASLPIIRKYVKHSKNIRFSGDNYSEEWVKEAEKRKLPNLNKSIDAFESFMLPKTAEAFSGVLTEQELASLYEISAERFANMLNIEVNLMIDIFRTQILPAAIKYQKDLAKSLNNYKKLFGSLENLTEQTKYLAAYSKMIETAITLCNELSKEKKEAEAYPIVKKAKFFASRICSKCEELRVAVDLLEAKTDDDLWPLPKYRELLFIV